VRASRLDRCVGAHNSAGAWGRCAARHGSEVCSIEGLLLRPTSARHGSTRWEGPLECHRVRRWLPGMRAAAMRARMQASFFNSLVDFTWMKSNLHVVCSY
jgi:hypothetical protein